jgi:hypothetical protein
MDTTGSAFSASTSGTVQGTLTWNPDFPGDAPTDPVTVEEYGNAGWEIGYSDLYLSIDGFSANDGFNDPPYEDDLPSIYACQGNHLTSMHPKENRATGIYTLAMPPRFLSCALNFSPMDMDGFGDFLPYSAQAEAYYEAYIDPNNRGAFITSSIDPTYHKGHNGLPEQDRRDKYGTMHANSVIPSTSDWITYYGNESGWWGGGSSYLIHCSSGDPPGGSDPDNTASGSFSSPVNPVGLLSMTYGPSATAEHAYLHLTDSYDGANATSNYYVKFNPEIENWAETSQTPGPAAPGGGEPGPEWKYVTAIDNDTPVAQTTTLTKQCSVSMTETATIGGSASLDAAELASLQVNTGITNGNAVTATIGVGYQFVGAPWTYSEFYIAPAYTSFAGTCDVYGASGFIGTEDWTAVEATGVAVTYDWAKGSYTPND